MSCSVLFRACPRCNAPVTFGGGITMQYGLRLGIRLGVEITGLFPSVVHPALGCGEIESIGNESAEN